jgi:hypothetical protein
MKTKGILSFYYLGIQDWLSQNGIGLKNDFRIGFNIQIQQHSSRFNWNINGINGIANYG